MLEDFFKNHLINILVTCVTALAVFAFSFGGISNQVQADTNTIKSLASQNDLHYVVNSQTQENAEINKRLDTMENKIDKIYSIEIERKR